MILIDSELVEQARRGSRAALDEVVRVLQRPIYNLALRMLANPADAEEAAQEIIIKVVTNLGGVRETAAAGAWAMRVAMRHLVHERKRGRLEAARFTFRSFGADLQDGLADYPETAEADPLKTTLIAQVKIGCTLALLSCLTRPLRGAYILGEVYELSDLEAASVLEIAPAAYRQRLKRARAMVIAFTQRYCGLVVCTAPCHCERRIDRAVALGRVQPNACMREATSHDVGKVQLAISILDRERRAAALMRSNPDFVWQAKGLDILESATSEAS